MGTLFASYAHSALNCNWFPSFAHAAPALRPSTHFPPIHAIRLADALIGQREWDRAAAVLRTCLPVLDATMPKKRLVPSYIQV